MEDNFKFLHESLEDDLQAFVDQIFGSKSHFGINNKLYSKQEFKAECFDNLVEHISDNYLEKLFDDSNETAMSFDKAVNMTKEKYNDVLFNTFNFLKTLAVKSHDVYDYIESELGFEKSKEIDLVGRNIIKFTLLKLLFNFLMTLGEVIVLAERGFVYGAEARWRQLNEITVISNVISQEDDVEMTKMFLDHSAVHLKKAVNNTEHYIMNEKSFVDKINTDYEDLINIYGKDFKNQYGWYKKNQKINFSDLSKKYSLDKLKGYVNISNMSVHASSHNILKTEHSFKADINNLEIPLQNSVINLINIIMASMYYLIKTRGKETATDLSIMLFYQKSFKKIAELYFDERHELDKSKPKFSEIDK